MEQAYLASYLVHVFFNNIFQCNMIEALNSNILSLAWSRMSFGHQSNRRYPRWLVTILTYISSSSLLLPLKQHSSPVLKTKTWIRNNDGTKTDSRHMQEALAHSAKPKVTCKFMASYTLRTAPPDTNCISDLDIRSQVMGDPNSPHETDDFHCRDLIISIQ